MTTKLVGMFFIAHGGGFLNEGKVLDAITPTIYLVQMKANEAVPVEAAEVSELCDIADMMNWDFFETLEARDAHLNWLITPTDDEPTDEGEPVKLSTWKKRIN